MILLRRAVAEGLGTAFLLIAVVGSGIAAQRLSPGDVGLELLENALATGAALVAVILTIGSVSGAHLNPLVSLLDWRLGGLRAAELGVYCAAQLVGAVVGAVLANAMFMLPAVAFSEHVRSGGGMWLGETVATFGLLLVIFGVVRSRRVSLTPFAVGAYITAAYFFTSSTSFANPAVSMARMLSNSFSGVAPGSVPAFVGFEVLGAVLAYGAIKLLWPRMQDVAGAVVVPHPESSKPA